MGEMKSAYKILTGNLKCRNQLKNLGVDRKIIIEWTTASRTVLGPTQPPIQWVPEALSLGVKRPGREADH
jgi:hypothetical protein